MLKTWGAGAVEMLDHAEKHIDEVNAFDKRIAFISIDNAVELAMRAFLSLPKKMYPFIKHTRKEVDECNNSFSEYLLLLEKHYSHVFNGTSIGDIEFYHRIRNDLYHEGTGKSVDINQLTAYYIIATNLINRLFSESRNSKPSDNMLSIEKIIIEWEIIESLLIYICPGFIGNNYGEFTKYADFPLNLVGSIKKLTQTRNKIVHLGIGEVLNNKEADDFLIRLKIAKREIEDQIKRNEDRIKEVNMNYYPSESILEGIIVEAEVCKFLYMEDDPNPELVKVWYLDLLKPINVHQNKSKLEEGDFDYTRYNVSSIQLAVLDNILRERLINQTGIIKKVKGTLFGGHTYHHRRDIVMNLIEIVE